MSRRARRHTEPPVPTGQLGVMQPLDSVKGWEGMVPFRPLTLILQVAQVQDGGQELRNLPVLSVGEHEHLHGGADVGVLLVVFPAFTRYAVTLVGR